MSNTVTANEGDTGDPASLPPLTRNGYTRTEKTEADIHALMGMGPAQLTKSFAASEGMPDYRGCEALVFFIRRAWRAGDSGLMNSLAAILIERCEQYFGGMVRGLDSEERLDAQNDVFEDMFKLLLASDDRGDFLESRFLTYLKRETVRVCGLIRQQHYRGPLIADYVEDADDEDRFVATHQHEQKLAERDQTENRAAIRRAVASLPSPLLRLVVLRYFKKWPIGDERNKNSDDQRVTLAKKYDVRPRTIHNWLVKAYELMEKFWKDDQ